MKLGTRYPGYLRLIDSFGVLAIISASAYMTLPESMRPPHRAEELWGNISSELVGIWLAVRLIDYAIKRHEGATKARVRVVRGMRYIERLFANFQRFPYAHELSELLREFRWNKLRLINRSKHLSRDEQADAERFYDAGLAIIGLLPDIAPKHQDKIEYPVERYDELLASLELARQRAEQNILEETDEDSGL